MIERRRVRANLSGLKVYEQQSVREQKPVIKKNLLREMDLSDEPDVQTEVPVVHPIVDNNKIAGLRFVCPCGCNATVLFEQEVATEPEKKAMDVQAQDSV